MHQPNKRRGWVRTTAVGVLALGAVCTTPAFGATYKNAHERAAEKRAALEAQQAKRAAEAAKFDPFAVTAVPAPGAPAAKAPTPAPAAPAAETPKNITSREAALARISSVRAGYLKVLGASRTERRSPNQPPPFTPRRPSDPPGPPPNVPPGPPQHAPPGPPPGVGNANPGPNR